MSGYTPLSIRMSPDLPLAFVHDVIANVQMATGVDFGVYRQPMLHRRIRNHMLAAGVEDEAVYVQRLRESTSFVTAAIERYTIKVSRFYRDPDVFAYLAGALRQIAAQNRCTPLRLWSAGCAHGEEAYTLAMLLEDANVPGMVVASDIDGAALHDARLACYGESALSTLPDTWRERFLEPVHESTWMVRPAIRSRVHFMSHDLTGDRPLDQASFDVVCCRNVLIYFQSAAQQRALHHLLGALHPGGTVVLGEAEWPVAPLNGTLTAVSTPLRIFRSALTTREAA